MTLHVRLRWLAQAGTTATATYSYALFPSLVHAFYFASLWQVQLVEPDPQMGWA